MTAVFYGSLNLEGIATQRRIGMSLMRAYWLAVGILEQDR